MFFRILRNKIGSISGHIHSHQYPVKQSSTPSLPLSNSSAAAMAYSGLYQHFPPYTPPISSPTPTSTVSNNNNNNSSSTSHTTNCSPTKSEPDQHHSSTSPSCYKWPGAGGPGGQEPVSRGGAGAPVPDILSPFQSYDQHQQAAAHNLNYYMYLQSQSMNHPSSGPTSHHSISSHYNNSIANNI